MRFPLPTTTVRYIKLGEGGSKRDEFCMKKQIAFLHFGSNRPTIFALCRERRWEDLKRYLRDEDNKPSNSATNIANQFEAFIEDKGETLWVTFFAGRLWWAFLSPEQPSDPDPDLGYVRSIAGVWQSSCRPSVNEGKSASLAMDDLSGRITKTASFRGTSCSLGNNEARYLINRINGTLAEEVKAAVDAREKLRLALVGVIKLLTPQDFELLVEHIFTSAGWRRISSTGKVLEVVDIVLEQPLDTSRRIFAQVKSTTGQKELDSYIEAFEQRRGMYEQMFYVYHSKKGELRVPGDVEGVVLMGPDQVADKVIDAGVVSWLIDKAR